MGRLTTYTLMMSGLLLLFYFTGLLTECDDDGMCEATSPNSQLLNFLLRPERSRSSIIGQKGILILEGVGAVLIIAAGLFIGNVELAVMGSFAIYYFNLGWDFLAVFNVVREANPVIAVLLFGPVLFFYVIIIIDWWRGHG